MTPTAQRIAIATACGWEHKPNGYWQPPTPDADLAFDNLFDYLTDLNAMHEAEKVLSPQQQKDYALQWLPSVLSISGREYRSKACEFIFAHATATQRAEAFLRTLDLWDPTK